ncbi:MAG: hypothetical protein ACREFY_12625, partial [Acetobacteraceae bacterium]
LGIRPEGATPQAGRDRTAPDPRAGVRLTQPLMSWNATRMVVGKQIDLLQNAILAASDEEEEYPDILANIGNLDAVMSRLDDSLSAKLSELRTAPDAAAKATAADYARKMVQGLQPYVADDELLADISGNNGFLPLDIKARL